MNFSCEIVRDLLPLFIDEVCSEHSKRVVMEHLQQCESCRKLVEGTRSIPELMIKPEQQESDKAIAKSLKRIRQRWVLSVVLVLLIIPGVLLGILTYNQVRGNGICFSNINEIHTSNSFVDALESEDFQRAASYIDYTDMYDEIQILLERQVNSYAPQLIEVRIGEEHWIAEKEFAQRYLADSSDALQTWPFLAINGIDGVMIPATIWQEIIKSDPSIYRKEIDGTELLNGYRYKHFMTVWGEFVVQERSLDGLSENNLSKFVYDKTVCLIPAVTYQDIKYNITETANKAYQAVHLQYADVENMSMNEFHNFMSTQYASELGDVFNSGYSLSNIRYESAYKLTDSTEEWTVVFSGDLVGADISHIVYIDITCNGNSIIGVSMHYSGKSEWCNAFVDAIFIYTEASLD